MSSQFLLHIHILISFCDQSITLTVGCGNDHETNCAQLFTQIGNFRFTNRKRQKISIYGSVSIHANFTQNVVKIFWIFDSLSSKRCHYRGKANLRSKVKFCLQIFAISHLRHTHIQDSHQEITEIINGKSLNLGTAQ